MNLKKKSQKAVVIFAVVVSALTLTFIAKMYTDDLFKTEEVVTNQINQELVDAFEKGQVSLLDPVPQRYSMWIIRMIGRKERQWENHTNGIICFIMENIIHIME